MGLIEVVCLKREEAPSWWYLERFRLVSVPFLCVEGCELTTRLTQRMWESNCWEGRGKGREGKGREGIGSVWGKFLSELFLLEAEEETLRLKDVVKSSREVGFSCERLACDQRLQ